jgi:hypothetical protein
MDNSNGRGGEIRTPDLYVPNVALYQAKLRPDTFIPNINPEESAAKLTGILIAI